jgi:hypothetical protein
MKVGTLRGSCRRGRRVKRTAMAPSEATPRYTKGTGPSSLETHGSRFSKENERVVVVAGVRRCQVMGRALALVTKESG